MHHLMMEGESPPEIKRDWKVKKTFQVDMEKIEKAVTDTIQGAARQIRMTEWAAFEQSQQPAPVRHPECTGGTFCICPDCVGEWPKWKAAIQEYGATCTV